MKPRPNWSDVVILGGVVTPWAVGVWTILGYVVAIVRG